jgi:hypothetical protein
MANNFYLPRSNRDFSNVNAGQGDVKESILYNLQCGSRSDWDGILQSNPNSQMESSTSLHNYWIGFHHHLIDGERLRGPSAEAILQLSDLNLVPSSQGQKGEEDQGFHAEWWLLKGHRHPCTCWPALYMAQIRWISFSTHRGCC